MSFGMLSGRGAGGMAADQSINPNTIAMAEQEIDMVTDTFNRMVDVCHTKCIQRKYTDPELHKGEAVCADRCVAKFFAITKRVGEKMMEQQKQQ